MSLPRSNYYLSIERQIQIINQVSSFLRTNFIAKLTPPLDGKKQQVIDNFDYATQTCKDLLTNAAAKESKLPHDNTLILAYIKNIEGIFEYGKIKLGEHSSLFDKGIECCREYPVYLNNALDIQVYKVILTEENCNNLLENSRRFHCDRKFKKASKVVEGIAALIFFYPFQAIDEFWDAAERRLFAHPDPAEPPGAPITYKNSIDYIEGNCYSTNTDTSILPECIEGTVDKTGTIKKLNNNFADSTLANSNSRVIYVVDANNPEVVLSRGLTYDNSSENPYGKLIFFLKLRKAYEFINNRCGEEVSFFDNNCGWRQNNPWTTDTLTGEKEKVKAALRSMNFFPSVVSQIIGEYISVDLPQASAPKATRKAP